MANYMEVRALMENSANARFVWKYNERQTIVLIVDTKKEVRFIQEVLIFYC